jgi:hypothetical protein
MAMTPNTVKVDASSTEDIVMLATALAKNPQMRQAIMNYYKDAGSVEILHQVISEFCDNLFSTIGWLYDNPINSMVAVTLARRIASGEINGNEACKLIQFADRNKARVLNVPPAHVNEVLFVARALVGSPEIHSALSKVATLERYIGQESNEVFNFVHQIALREGMAVRRASFSDAVEIATRVVLGEYATPDGPEAIEYLIRSAELNFPTCVLTGASNV